ncbi:MAG TPA: malto-oligosyltrehalose synthase [Xanthobacteraceae bacterium]|nr:malto-oligosyltrehalose synthase [Xanthobacteraceae bacterium]
MSPRATLRLQFNNGFTFDHAARLVPYFAALGVSHLYASPILTARAGSTHGYDVVDPTRVNPRLGGEDGLRRLVAALRQAGLGLVVDIVPNHMAIGRENPWWLDVLEHGRASRHARFFDIDWEPEDAALRGKVLLPVLGRPYGEALDAGEIALVRDETGGKLCVRYFEHMFPLAAPGEIELSPADAFDPARPQGRQRLHDLLERQHYRLAWWRTAGDEINWRRFFDINDLIALRMEDDQAFEATHAVLFRLYGQGLIDGVRVDHVDGLADPHDYCRRLKARLDALNDSRPADAPSERAYIVVEKILARDEQLSDDWGCDGTTGYDFMDEVGALLHDPDGEPALTRLWAAVSGRSPSFAAEEEASRRQIIERSFSAQLNAVALAFHRLARANIATRDVSRAALRRALVEILAHFPVYRIHATPERRAQADLSFLARAVAMAQTTCLAGDRTVVGLLGHWLAGDAAHADARPLQTVAMTRFHQLSAPVCAKAVEDTAFYRYGRLLSRNDVGFDANRFADTPAEFHARMAARAGRFPHSMLATATHDHKRGEDVRARLAALSELADEWSAALERWVARSDGLRSIVQGVPCPAPGDLAILFQTMIGAWPPNLALGDAAGLRDLAERLARWQQKALREAKLASDWMAPNEAYEAAARDVVVRLFAGEDAGLLADIAGFAERIAPAGAANGLTQVLLKLTVPGVPDIYQGTEYWDLSLVDPDNRRPVDFAARASSLGASPIAELTRHWRDGRIKQAVIARALAARQAAPRLFAEGTYLRIDVDGALAKHVIAFARQLDDLIAVTIVCRLPTRLLRRTNDLSIASSSWRNARLKLPAEWRGSGFRDVITGAIFEKAPSELARIFAQLPVALLVVNRREAADLFGFAAAHSEDKA